MNTVIRIVIAIVCGYIAATVLRSVIPIRILFYPELVLVAWGTWAWIPKFIPALQATAHASGKPIDIVEEGDWTVVNVTPAPLGMARYVILGVFFGIGIGFLAGMATNSALIAIPAGVIGAALYVLLGKSFMNSKRGVQNNPFAVRKDAIRLPAGSIVHKAEMYRILVTNATDGTYVNNPFNTGTTMGTTMVAAHSAMAASNLKAFGKVAFIVNLEHNGIRSPLAGGLTEPQAHAVFEEIRRRVDAFQTA